VVQAKTQDPPASGGLLGAELLGVCHHTPFLCFYVQSQRRPSQDLQQRGCSPIRDAHCAPEDRVRWAAPITDTPFG
jgi:hypothetical protein